jgi:hypothetical protein
VLQKVEEGRVALVDTLRRIQHNKMLRGMLFISIAILLVIVAIASFYKPVEAQDEVSDFYTFLRGLHQRMQNDGVLITLTLITPFETSQHSVTIGYGYDNITTSISEIGKDYLCLREIEGGAEIITCIPFTNIAAVDYINN